ncbi:hypothetical protein DVH24_004647 [Malus domestica]|uniref:Peptidase C1A papain C-terminal domain-containing protein n=1 Tax=Malus domestica TaxID=3750 RepID=A0A498IHM6_MALDO|nr:hypothetical protein DVH24_004647 [Malus domestica]
MQMMKAFQTHPAIVLIISIDLHFRNYKHGVYVSSLDEPCEAHTHAVTLLGWGTYEEKITDFGLKKRKRDEAPNVGWKLLLVMHMRELDMRFRVREESWQVVIVPPG